MYHTNFKYLQYAEVARPTICGFDTQKSPFFGSFFAVFSGTAQDLEKYKKGLLV